MEFSVVFHLSIYVSDVSLTVHFLWVIEMETNEAVVKILEEYEGVK